MTILDTLVWFNHHRSAYLWLAGSVIIAALIGAVRPFLRGRPDERREHDWTWCLVILAVLVAGRWPSFFASKEFNPDESQFLAGARVLWLDPVFSRSIDGETSGPLNFFALWPAGLVCGWHSYLAARVTATLMLAGAFGLAHQIMAIVLGKQVARAAGLGVVCLEALTNAPDFLHYSSELLPMLLLTVAGYAAVRRWLDPEGWGWAGLGGLALGAAPLAKLQAAPMAILIGGVWFVAELTGRDPAAPRRRAYLVGAALLPAALFACQITLAGDWANVYVPYFSYNLQQYAKLGTLSLGQQWQYALSQAVNDDSLLTIYVPAAFAWGLAMVRPLRTHDRPMLVLAGAAAVISVVAAYCAYRPGRGYLHYAQFLAVPVTLVLGSLMRNLLDGPTRGRRRVAYGTVIAGAAGLVLGLLVHRVQRPNAYFGALIFYHLAPRSDLGAYVAAHSEPGESVAIWGWSNYVYVEADLVQATQSPHFGRATTPGPYQQFFRRRFIANLQALKPELFLDSSGPSSLVIAGDPAFAHDLCFPELASVIRADYRLVGGVNGARLYRRIRPDHRRPASTGRTAADPPF